MLGSQKLKGATMKIKTINWSVLYIVTRTLGQFPAGCSEECQGDCPRVLRNYSSWSSFMINEYPNKIVHRARPEPCPQPELFYSYHRQPCSSCNWYEPCLYWSSAWHPTRGGDTIHTSTKGPGKSESLQRLHMTCVLSFRTSFEPFPNWTTTNSLQFDSQ